MSRVPTVQDWAKLKEHNYKVEKFDPMGALPGWQLLDPDGYQLMIGSHGCIAPTRYEAVAEGLRRIELEERLREELGDPTLRELHTAVENRSRATRERLEAITDIRLTDRLIKISVVAEVSAMLWPEGDSPVMWKES